MHLIPIEIDRDCVLRQIGIVKSIAINPFPIGPFFKFLQVLAQPVGEHLGTGRELFLYRPPRPCCQRLPTVLLIQHKLQQLTLESAVVEGVDFPGTQADGTPQLRI